MNFYQEITLLPDSDIALGFLWQKLYQQVHIALVENKIDEYTSAIGVGFAHFSNKKFPLGDKLRLFAHKKEQLENLGIGQYLQRLSDCVHIKSIQAVPQNVQHVLFVRKTVKGASRIEQQWQQKAQYKAKKEGKSLTECLAELNAIKPDADNKLPFIWMQSQQTKRLNSQLSNKFPLFIEQVKLNNAQEGLFNCYGLAQKRKQDSSSPVYKVIGGSVPMF